MAWSDWFNLCKLDPPNDRGQILTNRDGLEKSKGPVAVNATGPFYCNSSYLFFEVNTCIVDSEVRQCNTLTARSEDELVISLELL